jgi:DNA invertase Pin-like site-specific DNA recombinase
MTDYIAYYRVSTDRQGQSGLGLDAQRASVTGYIGERGQLLNEFTEIESGKSHTNRPELQAALAACRFHRATLIIARLDRLARNVHFISGLMESKVDFVAVDMPQADHLTLHILASVAEHERKMISQRTRSALAQAKARGTKLGNPRIAEARAKALATQTQRPAPEVLDLITEKRVQGKGLREIARELNRLNLRTPRGNQWHAKTIRDQLDALSQL